MRRFNLSLLLSVVALGIGLVSICCQVFIFSERVPSPEMEYRDMINRHLQNFSAPLPDSLRLCGQPVPLDNVFVREALDRELTTIMYQHASTFLILKRSWRFFPEMESLLAEFGAPEDLKYLAVAESALNDVVSPAKASGFWQFMPATAKEYGLEVNAEWDERYDLRKSTKAAVQFLKAAYGRFGEWALACAAYNCGEAGVRAKMRQQECKSYWELAINSETARYVYRILAYKILMQNPQQYGFYVRKKDCYQALEYNEIVVDTSISDMPAFARKLDCPYKYFLMLNPCVRSNKLTNKSGKKYVFRTLKEKSLSWTYLCSRIKDENEFLE